MPNVGGVGGASAQRWGSQRLGVDEVPTLWPPLGTVGDAETGRGSEASCRSGGKVPFNSAPHQAASRSELVADAQGPLATRSRSRGSGSAWGGQRAFATGMGGLSLIHI
mgnify:CR=1 FL=1